MKGKATESGELARKAIRSEFCMLTAVATDMPLSLRRITNATNAATEPEIAVFSFLNIFTICNTLPFYFLPKPFASMLLSFVGQSKYARNATTPTTIAIIIAIKVISIC